MSVLSNDSHDSSVWSSYLRLRRWTLWLWLAWFPFMALLFLAPTELRRDFKWIIFGVCLLWVVTLMVMFLTLNLWPCPRCQSSFFLRYGILKSSGRECPSCHLPYLADPGTETDARR